MITHTEMESLAQAPKRTLRVLQVFGSLGMGGAETWLLSLLRYFNASKEVLPFAVTTDICLTSGVPGELDREAMRLGAKLHYLRYSRKHLLTFTRHFRRLLATNRFDAIHDHQDYSAGIHFLMGLGHLPAVKIAHVHNPAYRLVEHRTDAFSRWAGAVGERVLHHTHATVAGTSRQLLKEYGFDVDPSHSGAARAVYCGFDVASYNVSREECRSALRAEFGWSAADPVILFVGRLGGDELITGGRSHKNPMFALQVFEQSLTIRPGLRMLFVGEKGKMHGVLDGIVTARNLQASVRFLGIRSDVPRLMLGADALLFPSSAEGLGMVTVEAQAAGLRVLASDATPGECVVIPSLVRFLPLDAGIGVWVDTLLELIDLPSPDHSACNAAVASSRFSIANSARQLLEMYSRGMSAD